MKTVYDDVQAHFKTKSLITEPAENPMKSRQKQI